MQLTGLINNLPARGTNVLSPRESVILLRRVIFSRSLLVNKKRTNRKFRAYISACKPRFKSCELTNSNFFNFINFTVFSFQL